MKNSFTTLKESLIIYRNNFLIFASIIALSFLAKLIISPIAYSKLSYGGLIFFILMIPVFAWQNLATLYVIKNHKIKIGALNPYIKTANQIAPFSIVYACMIFSMIGGFVLLIIPSIILGIYLSLSSYTYFFERSKGFDALSRSIDYVMGNWFSVTRKILSLVIVLFFVGWIIPHIAAKIFPASLARIISDFLVELLTTPISAIYLYLVYLSLMELSKSKDEPKIGIVIKRKTKLKVISALGLLSFLVFAVWMIIKNPDSFSYKAMEQKLTEEQRQEMIRLREKYPEAQQIRIRIDEKSRSN